MSACAPTSAGDCAGTPPIFSKSASDEPAIADHAIAALDEVFGDRQADLADADEADGFH